MITASINHPDQSLLPGDVGWIKLSTLPISLSLSFSLSPPSLSHSLSPPPSPYKCHQLIARRHTRGNSSRKLQKERARTEREKGG